MYDWNIRNSQISRRLSGESGQLMLFLVVGVSMFLFSVAQIFNWIPRLQVQRVRAQEASQYNAALLGTLQYGQWLVVTGTCLDLETMMAARANMDPNEGPVTGQDGCPRDLADLVNDDGRTVNLVRVRWPEAAVTHPTEGVNARLGRPVDDRRAFLGESSPVVLNFDVAAIAASNDHPLRTTFLGFKGDVNFVRLVISRVMNVHLPHGGNDVYVKFRAEINANTFTRSVLENGVRSFLNLGTMYAETTIGFHPDYMKSYAVKFMGNLDLSGDSSTSSDPFSAVIPRVPFAQLDSGSRGLLFLGQVEVQGKRGDPTAGIILPAANQQTAVTFSDRVVIRDGALMEAVSGNGGSTAVRRFSPATPGGVNDTFYTQLNRFGGFLRGLVLKGRRDPGLDVLSGAMAGVTPNNNRVKECQELVSTIYDLSKTAGADVVTMAEFIDEDASPQRFELLVGLTHSNQITQQENITSEVTSVEPGLSSIRKKFQSHTLNVTPPSRPVVRGTVELVDGSNDNNGHIAVFRLGRNGDSVTFNFKPIDISGEQNALENATATVNSLQNAYDNIMSNLEGLRSALEDTQNALDANNLAFRNKQAQIEGMTGVTVGPPGQVSQRDSKIQALLAALSARPANVPSLDNLSDADNWIAKQLVVDERQEDLDEKQETIDNHNATNYDDQPAISSEVEEAFQERESIRAARGALKSARDGARTAYRNAIRTIRDYRQAVAARDDAQERWDEVSIFQNVSPRLTIKIDNHVVNGKDQRNFIHPKIIVTDGFAFQDGMIPVVKLWVYDGGYDGSGNNLRTGNQMMDEVNVVYKFRMGSSPRKLLADNTFPTQLQPRASEQDMPINGGNPLNNMVSADRMPDPTADFQGNREACLDEDTAVSTNSAMDAFTEQAQSSWHFSPLVPGSSAWGTYEFTSANARTSPSGTPDANRAVGGANYNWPVFSILNECVIKSSANFVVGFYTCMTLRIESRSTPLTIIGSFIVKNLDIHKNAIKKGISWYSIYHPDALTLLREQRVLGATVGGCNDLYNITAWNPEPSIINAAKVYACNASALGGVADPFEWTQGDPACGRPDPNNPNTICMRIPEEFTMGVISFATNL